MTDKKNPARVLWYGRGRYYPTKAAAQAKGIPDPERMDVPLNSTDMAEFLSQWMVPKRVEYGTKIYLQRNPKPIPIRKFDWDCWIDGREEDGSSHGQNAWDALRDLADRLEDEADA